MRSGTLIATLALAGVAGCGGGGDGAGTIPPENAETMLGQLDGVRTAIDDGNCTTAKTDASQFVEAVNGLPEETGVEIKEKLRQAGENLDELIAKECEETGVTGETGVEPATTTEAAPAPAPDPVEQAPPPDEGDDEESAPPQQPPGEGGGPPSGGGSGGVGGEKGKHKKPKHGGGEGHR